MLSADGRCDGAYSTIQPLWGLHVHYRGVGRDQTAGVDSEFNESQAEKAAVKGALLLAESRHICFNSGGWYQYRVFELDGLDYKAQRATYGPPGRSLPLCLSKTLIALCLFFEKKRCMGMKTKLPLLYCKYTLVLTYLRPQYTLKYVCVHCIYSIYIHIVSI